MFAQLRTVTCVRFLPMRSAGEEDMVQEACTGWAQGRLSDPRAALRTAHMLRRPSTPGGAFIKVPCETLAPCSRGRRCVSSWASCAGCGSSCAPPAGSAESGTAYRRPSRGRSLTGLANPRGQPEARARERATQANSIKPPIDTDLCFRSPVGDASVHVIVGLVLRGCARCVERQMPGQCMHGSSNGSCQRTKWTTSHQPPRIT